MAKIKKVETNENLTEEDVSKVVKYFTKPSMVPWVLIGVGVLGLVISPLISIIFIPLGIYMLNQQSKNKVTDAEFDEIKSKAYGTLKYAALNKLGLDESDTVREPLFIKAPRYYDRADAPLIFKEGEDGILRYSLHNIVVINFTKKHLALYTCALDLQTGNRLNECTEEFFYKDVVSVGTQTKTSSSIYDEDAGMFTYIKKGGASNIEITQKNKWECFELRNSGGGVITVPLKSDTVLKQMGGKFEASEIDNAVNSIRAILKDKK